jgi:hypothetical protein
MGVPGIEIMISTRLNSDGLNFATPWIGAMITLACRSKRLQWARMRGYVCAGSGRHSGWSDTPLLHWLKMESMQNPWAVKGLEIWCPVRCSSKGGGEVSLYERNPFQYTIWQILIAVAAVLSGRDEWYAATVLQSCRTEEPRTAS